jgi:hypothetical protein
MIHAANLIVKFERVEKVYREKVTDTPKIVYDTFAAIRKRLQEADAKYGNSISPLDLK